MEVPDHLRCKFRAADGKRCRMFRDVNHPFLCHAHARRTLPPGRGSKPGQRADRQRDVVRLDPPSAADVHAMLNQGIIWLAGRLITTDQGNRLVRCVRRAQRRDPYATFDLADLWKELCETVALALSAVEGSRLNYKEGGKIISA